MVGDGMTAIGYRLSVVGWGRRAAILAGAVAACAKPAPPPAPAGPPYVFYYQDGAGVHRLDAGRGADSVLFAVGRPRVASALSPDGTKLAIGYSGSDSARLVVVDVVTGAVRRLHAAGRAHQYTLAWSRDGARLAAGYFTERRAGRETLPGAGDIVIVSLDGRWTRVGCEASKVVYAWVAADTIVVSDGRELNPVDIRGCRANASIRLQGKREVTFSPDGKRVFYLAASRVRQGRRTVTATALYVARYDGSGARRVIGEPYDPRHPRWSPDGARIAFDVRAPQGGRALRHIAVFEAEQQRVRFFPSRTADGSPSDTDPFWAPQGAVLVHDRTISGHVEKILRTLALDPAAVHVEPTVLMSGGPLGTVWGWADESHVALATERGAALISTAGAVIYELPHGRTLLHVARARP